MAEQILLCSDKLSTHFLIVISAPGIISATGVCDVDSNELRQMAANYLELNAASYHDFMSQRVAFNEDNIYNADPKPTDEEDEYINKSQITWHFKRMHIIIVQEEHAHREIPMRNAELVVVVWRSQTRAKSQTRARSFARVWLRQTIV